MSLELLAGNLPTDDLLASGWAYGGLFASAFAAATLLPTASEGLLMGLAATGRLNPWLLLLFASLGNVLGACVNWASTGRSAAGSPAVPCRASPAAAASWRVLCAGTVAGASGRCFSPGCRSSAIL